MGASNLTGRQLPPERVAAAAARIDVLAKSALCSLVARRLAGDGDPRPIDHLRAEVFLCLTEGTWAGYDDAGILEALRASRPGVEPGAPAEPLDGVELRLSLYAALGLDLEPGELAGHGPVHTAHALAILANLGAGQWRWVLLDSTGHLLCSGLTPARPTGYAARSGECDSVVDLHVHAGLLDRCVEAAASGGMPDFLEPEVWDAWRPVLVDIAARAAEPPPPSGDPDRRFAGAHLRRDVQLADGRCVGVGCRAPARRSDLDHRHDHAKGGKTTPENSAPACRRDHRRKHEGGWILEAVAGGYRWTSRLQHTYEVLVPPVWRQYPAPAEYASAPSPARPEPDRDLDSLGRPWEDSGLWAYTPPDTPPF